MHFKISEASTSILILKCDPGAPKIDQELPPRHTNNSKGALCAVYFEAVQPKSKETYTKRDGRGPHVAPYDGCRDSH